MICGFLIISSVHVLILLLLFFKLMLTYINGGLQSKLATTFTHQNKLCFIWGDQNFLKEMELIRKGAISGQLHALK
jgi:hypothetical protein